METNTITVVDKTRVVLALIVGGVSVFLAIIMAFFFDEMLDNSTERACVEKTVIDSDDCDV